MSYEQENKRKTEKQEGIDEIAITEVRLGGEEGWIGIKGNEERREVEKDEGGGIMLYSTFIC